MQTTPTSPGPTGPAPHPILQHAPPGSISAQGPSLPWMTMPGAAHARIKPPHAVPSRWRDSAIAKRLLTPHVQTGLERHEIIRADDKGYLLEIDNGCRQHPSQPWIELEVDMQAATRDDDEIAVIETRRAASPGRVRVDQKLMPRARLLKEDALARLVANEPLIVKAGPEDSSTLPAFKISDLDALFMKVEPSREDGCLRMSDADHRRKEALERVCHEARERGEVPPKSPLLQYTATTLDFRLKGGVVELTCTERVFNGKHEEKRSRTVETATIRFERLPRAFLDLFTNNKQVKARNQHLDRTSQESLSRRFPVPSPSTTEDETSAEDPTPVERPQYAPAFHHEALLPPLDPPPLATSGPASASASRQLARLDAKPTALITRAGAFNLDNVDFASAPDGGLVLVRFRNHPRHRTEVVHTSLVPLAEGSPGDASALLARGTSRDDRQIKTVASVITSWNGDEDEVSVPQYWNLRDLDEWPRKILSGELRVGKLDPFKRENLVVTDPQYLRDNVFRVLTEGSVHGRRLIMDSDARWNMGREVRAYDLSPDGKTVVERVFWTRQAIDSARYRCSPVSTKTYLREYVPPKIMALMFGEGVEEWNANAFEQGVEYYREHRD